MPQFYARYIPPTKASNESQAEHKPQTKRKYDETPGGTGSRKPAKKLKASGQPKNNAKNATRAEHGSMLEGELQTKGEDVLSKYSIRKFANKQDTTTINIRNHEKTGGGGGESANNAPNNDEREHAPDEEDVSSRPASNDAEEHTQNQATYKHAGVFSKYEKSKVKSKAGLQQPSADKTDGDDDTHVEIHGLEPIPQPENVETLPYMQNFSSLPLWQSNPLRVSKSDGKSFDEMGISEQTLANLRKAEIYQAFPIQQAVIPLLRKEDLSLAPDICISATTGSGKTLAYALPIVEHLRKSKGSSLRAVVIVPTRELVKQVCDTFEMCAAGSGLRISTAMGTKSLSEEQAMMIEEEQVYDPHEYQKRQDEPINWLRYDLERELEAALQKPTVTTVNFVTRRRIKGDILITTPGRLVDHLSNTPNFDLDRVEWLVVDEADRLLDESYQQWLEAVIPALESRNAMRELDEVFALMRMDLPPRIVRKILLSATMTRDISKLNALKLHDPKLIILKSSWDMAPEQGLETQTQVNGEAPDSYSSETFQIPASLSESILTFKDGAERPLILLQLLQQNLGIFGDTDNNLQNLKNATSREGKGNTSSKDTDSSSDSSSDSGSSTTTSATSSSSSSSDDESTTSNSSTEYSRHAERTSRLNSNSIHKVSEPQTTRALVFARSTASASRLSRLLALIRPDLATKIATLTRSTASSASSRKALSSFRNGKTTILISTDRASRGIDVLGLENVINYDIPGSALTYLHRVGRTARAGSQGHSWTLVEHREGRWFWNEIGGKSKDCKISRVKAIRKHETKIDDEELRSKYENALQQLGEEVRSQ